MPELPEVETIRRQLEPEAWAQDRPCTRRCSTALVRARCCRRGSSGRCRRSAASRTPGGAASTWCWASRTARLLVMHLRMTGNLLIREPDEAGPLSGWAWTAFTRRMRALATCARGCSSTTAASCGSPTRGASATARSSRRASSTDYFASRARGRATRGGADAHAPARARRGPDRAAEVVSAQPGDDRRDREHLRRRGAFPRPSASALAGGLDAPRALRRSCSTGSSGRSRPGSRTAARRSTTTATRAASAARCRTSSSSTRARASPACAAARRSGGSWSVAARRTSVPTARCGCAVAPRRRK